MKFRDRYEKFTDIDLKKGKNFQETLVKTTNDARHVRFNRPMQQPRVSCRQKTIQVGKGFYLSTMNSKKGET